MALFCWFVDLSTFTCFTFQQMEPKVNLFTASSTKESRFTHNCRSLHTTQTQLHQIAQTHKPSLPYSTQSSCLCVCASVRVCVCVCVCQKDVLELNQQHRFHQQSPVTQFTSLTGVFNHINTDAGSSVIASCVSPVQTLHL